MTVENDEYMSQRSNEVKFSFTDVDYKVKVNVDNMTSSSVTLSWDAVKDIDGYIVWHDRPENVYMMGNVTTNTSETSIEGEFLFCFTPVQTFYFGDG